MTRWRRLAFLALMVPLVGCDHATKWMAETQLEGHGPHRLLGRVLDLRYAENTDVAFNLLRWLPEPTRAPLLLIAGGLAVAALLVLLARTTADGPRRVTAAALLLLTAGALGNYLDRVVRGYVVDFIHVPSWPVFNVADAYVVMGVVLLALWGRRRSSAPPAPVG